MYPNQYYHPPGGYPTPGYYSDPNGWDHYPEHHGHAGVSSYPEYDTNGQTSGCGCGNGTSGADYSENQMGGAPWAGAGQGMQWSPQMPQGWNPGQGGMQWPPQMPQGWTPGQYAQEGKQWFQEHAGQIPQQAQDWWQQHQGQAQDWWQQHQGQMPWQGMPGQTPPGLSYWEHPPYADVSANPTTGDTV